MATLDELQAQLEELNRRVNEITAPPDDYYTHRFSGEEIDNAVDRVKATPGSGAITAGDVGAAPSGFGFGELPRQFIFTDDTDGSKFEAGIQGFIDTMQNGKTYLVALQDYPFLNAVSFQALMWRTGTRVMIHGWNYNGHTVQRIYDDNTGWFPWEWVNPTLLLGTEYRTTERYNNRPVYKIAWPLGDFPNNTTKTVEIDTGTPGRIKAIRHNVVLDTSGTQANGMYGEGAFSEYGYLGLFLQNGDGKFTAILGSKRDVNQTATIFIDYIRE